MINKKRVFNECKKTELLEYDLSKGRLVNDRLLVAHHKATKEVQEVSHTEIVAEYPNGGKDVQTVIDTPYQPAREAWDEYEDIFVFVPYTEEDLSKQREQRYKAAIVKKIRERYTLDDELAIARQRDTKPEEWAEYNAYCEDCKTVVKSELVI